MSLIRTMRCQPFATFARTSAVGFKHITPQHRQIYVTFSIRSFATAPAPTPASISTPSTTSTSTSTSPSADTPITADIVTTSPPLTATAAKSVDNSITSKISALIHRYYNGGKLLFTNYKQYQTIQKRLKADPKTQLTRDEARLLYWFKRDAAAGGPFIAWFFLPLIGYTAPIVFHFMPQYLPSTFWTPEVRTQLRNAVIPLHLDVLTALHTILAEHEAVLDLQSARPLRAAMSLITRVRDGDALSDSELAQFQSILSDIIDWSTVRFTELEPALHWFGEYNLIGDYIARYIDTNNRMVNARLHRHIEFIKKDDAYLKEQGVTSLHGEDLIQALHERGLWRAQHPMTEREGHALLKRWIQWTQDAVARNHTYHQAHPKLEKKEDHHDTHGHDHVDPRSVPGYGNAFFVYAGALMKPVNLTSKKQIKH